MPPPPVPGVAPVGSIESDWWSEKSEKKKYLYVYNVLTRSNAYNAWKLSLRRRLRDRVPATWPELEPEHKVEFLDWFVASYQPDLPNVVKAWIWDFLMPARRKGR